MIEIDDELYDRLKEVARKRAAPSMVEEELAKAVQDYLDKWEMFLAGNIDSGVHERALGQ